MILPAHDPAAVMRYQEFKPDVAVLDPGVEWVVEPARFKSKGRNTPWKGKRVVGRCTHTIVGGRIVYEQGRADR